jgi:uroporphyrinogen-III synthase
VIGALVLRPEPGNRATLDRLRQAGVNAVGLPLFAIRPVAWSLPDIRPYDAVLFTSAQALRHGGEALAQLHHLPAIAVGAATAAATEAAGFHVAVTGANDVAAATEAAAAAGFVHPLHLAGRHRQGEVAAITVYESVAVDPPSGALAVAEGRVALLHSPRAARRFATLVDRDAIPRAHVGVAALSPAVLAAAGGGWGWHATADQPTDAALVALARAALAAD